MNTADTISAIQYALQKGSARPVAGSGISGKLDVKRICTTVGFYALPWQKKAFETLSTGTRFLTIPGGKRTGKTLFSAVRGLLELHVPGTKTWIVAPSYDLGGRIWDQLEKWCYLYFPYIKVSNKNNQPYLQNAQNLSWLKIKTADSKENLKGEALSLLLMDEAADVEDDVWYQFLQPNVRQKHKTPSLKEHFPQAVFIGNPQGKNWFYEMYQRGLNGEEGYASLHVPAATEKDGLVVSASNPHAFAPDELNAIKRQTPEHIWRSDYLAEFREDEGTVFKNLRRAEGGSIKKFQRGHVYEIGWDPAKFQDFSVITVVDIDTHEVVFHSRFQSVDWMAQIQRVKGVSQMYGGARVRIDSTGLGDPLYDMLRREGVNSEDFKFTARSKEALVEKLALLIEHGQIKIPKELKEVWHELEIFGYASKKGGLKYEAPQGKHDDCVMSLALAVWNITGEPRAGKREDIPYAIQKIRQQTRKFQYK